METVGSVSASISWISLIRNLETNMEMIFQLSIFCIIDLFEFLDHS